MNEQENATPPSALQSVTTSEQLADEQLADEQLADEQALFDSLISLNDPSTLQTDQISDDADYVTRLILNVLVEEHVTGFVVYRSQHCLIDTNLNPTTTGKATKLGIKLISELRWYFNTLRPFIKQWEKMNRKKSIEASFLMETIQEVIANHFNPIASS